MKCFHLRADAPDNAIPHEFEAPTSEAAKAAVQVLSEFTGREYDLWIPTEDELKAMREGIDK